MRTSFARTIAAFGAGLATWEAVVHFSLLVNRNSPTLFGIRLTPRLNALQTIAAGAFAVALALYAFRREGSVRGGRRAPLVEERLPSDEDRASGIEQRAVAASRPGTVALEEGVV